MPTSRQSLQYVHQLTLASHELEAMNSHCSVAPPGASFSEDTPISQIVHKKELFVLRQQSSPKLSVMVVREKVIHLLYRGKSLLLSSLSGYRPFILLRLCTLPVHCFCFFFFFGGTGVWTQALYHFELYLSNLPPFFALVILQVESHIFAQGWTQNITILPTDSLESRTTDMHHHTQLIDWDGVLLTFCPGWPLKLWSLPITTTMSLPFE
jgi:hypothetical protein